MRTWAVVVSSAVLAASSGLGSSGAASQEPPAPVPPEFRAGTAVVVLDVVARDKKGRPVRDLRADEIQVFENGEQCKVRSFRLVESEATLEAAAPGAVAAPATPVAPAEAAAPAPAPAAGGTAAETSGAPLNLVLLVFDQMRLEDARLAERAARDFVEKGMDARTRTAVFVIGRRLGLVEPFSADKEVLLQAIALATSGTNSLDRSLGGEARQLSGNARAAAGELATEEPSEAGDAATPTGERVAVATDPLDAKVREAMARAMRMSDSLQQQMEGQWSLFPLLALVKSMAPLSGRKTLLFLSPGLQVPPNLDGVFRTVVSEANRSNVSVYAVDTRGLSSQSDMRASAAALREAATTSMIQQTKKPGEPTTLAEMQIMDTAESSLRLNAQQTLSDLAEGTGGFLVANANDFGQAVDRVAADIRGYYEIQYSPVDVRFDGSFRRIGVKVARKDVVLQSRSGYFALPPSDQVMLPWEMPLFTALSAGTPPHDFPHQAAAMHFAPGPDGTETAVVVEVPLAAVDFDVDRKEKTFAQHLTTLAVVKDAEGRVVERFSDQYPLSGSLGDLEGLKHANAVLRRYVSLPPGRYTLETASRVKGTGKTSVERGEFEIPPADGGPQLSSFLLLRRADPLPADAPPEDDPFRYEGVRLVPNLGEAVSLASTPNLSFFARLYPDEEDGPAALTLEVVRDGTLVGQAEPPLPAPDASGGLAYVGAIPSSAFVPGDYEVSLTLSQDGRSATQSTRFELVP